MNNTTMNIITFFRNRYYLLTALLMPLAFPVFSMIPGEVNALFGWVALVPLLIYTARVSVRQAFFAAWGTGILGNLLTYGWVGNFGAEVPGGNLVILLFLVPLLTFFFSLRLLLGEYLSRKAPMLRFLLIPAAWIIVDWLQSVGYLAFPWTWWGYSQYRFTSFIQVASITGVYGVTFIVVMVQAAISSFITDMVHGGSRKVLLKKTAIIIMLPMLLTVWGAFRMNRWQQRPAGKEYRVAMVQSCIDPWISWSRNRFEYLKTLMRLSQDTLPQSPDLIIWSESATLEPLSDCQKRECRDPFYLTVKRFVRETGTPLLTGEIGLAKELSFGRVVRYPQNNAALFNHQGDILYSYAKMHLVPFGEWFPYEDIFPWIKRLVLSFGASSFMPGDTPLLFEVDDWKFGSLVCYEGIFHRQSRTYRRMGADFLVNITNDGWTNSYAGHIQHFSVAPFRAVENGLWFIRVGNTGLSTVLSPTGSEIESLPMLAVTSGVVSMFPEKTIRTIYTRFGDFFLYIAMAFAGVIQLFSILKRYGGRKEVD